MIPPPTRYCPLCDASRDERVCPVHGVHTLEPSALAQAASDPVIGRRVLDDRYLIEGVVGEGGMGRVYRGQQLAVSRQVALKVLHPDRASGRDGVRRFYREALAASRLTGPHVVRIHDFGFDASSHTPVLVMELLQGRTLAQALADDGAFALGPALRLVRHVASGLREAHEAGIVHRDLKPANIFLVPGPAGSGGEIAKVMDFGVAKDLTETGAGLTESGAVVGTPSYISPEQIAGEMVDTRADLYALGCVLHALLTGRPPFSGPSVHVVYHRHLAEPAPPLPDPLPSGQPLPAGLAALHQRLLAKEPDGRPATASAVLEAVEALGLVGERTPPVRPTPVVTPVTEALELDDETLAPASRVEPTVPTPPRRGHRGWLGMAVVVALAVGAVAAAESLDRPPPGASTPASFVRAAMLAPMASPPDAPGIEPPPPPAPAPAPEPEPVADPAPTAEPEPPPKKKSRRRPRLVPW